MKHPTPPAPQPPVQALEHLKAGSTAFNTGDLDRAAEAVQAAIRLNPGLSSAWFLLSEIASARGEAFAAMARLNQAIALEPGNANFRFRSGLLAQRQEEFDVAAVEYARCLELDAENVHALGNLVAAYCEVGSFAAAVKAVKRYPHLADAKDAAAHNIATAFSERARELQKIPGETGTKEHYLTALKYLGEAPEDALAGRVHHGVAACHFEDGEDELCLKHALRAVELRPDVHGYRILVGHAHMKYGRFAQALAIAREVLKERDDHAMAHVLLAVASRNLGDQQTCLEAFKRARELDSEHLYAELGYGYSLYEFGFTRAAWPLMVRRWEKPDLVWQWREFPQPHWQGENLAGKRLLYWGEQGIGDELMFANTLPDLLAAGAQICIECHPRLVPLYRRTYPSCEVYPRLPEPDPAVLDASIDFQCVAGSAAAQLRRDEDEFPRHAGYIRADATVASKLRERYCQSTGRNILIGISWSTTNKMSGEWRSIELKDWLPLFDIADVALVNLQYGEVAGEIEAFERLHPGRKLLHDPGIDPLEDMDRFAAQVAAVDLIVSIDNSTVHVAGALGKPVWNLLAAVAEWRWQVEREDTPWYPSMRLFRQRELFSWPPLMAQVAAAVRERFDSNRQQGSI